LLANIIALWFRSGAGHAYCLLPPSPYHQRVRRLEGPELEAYDLVPHELARRVRVTQVPFLPNHADGMTVGTWIFVRNDDDASGNRALLAHELVHVRQFAEQGRARFLARYVREYLRRRWTGCGHRQAYLDITAEVEARDEEAAWQRRRSSTTC
jgi:hypothetical protein